MARVGSTLALVSFIAGALVFGGNTVNAQSATGPAAAEGQDKAGGKAKSPAKKKSFQNGAEKSGGAAAEKSLETAQKSLDAGKADLAISQVNSVISAGGLDSRLMARALAIRGHAHKTQGKPAQAIADLQSALYLRNGLNDAERAAATQARAEAYRESGLGEPAPAQASTAPAGRPMVSAAAKPATSGAAAKAPAAASESTAIETAAVSPPRSAPPAETPSGGGNGIGTFFSNLFGGSQSQPSASGASSPVKAPAEPAVSSWSEPAASTKSKSATKTAAAGSGTKGATTAVVPSGAARQGGFILELASVRSQEEATRTAEKVRKEYRDAIGERKYNVVQTTFGNMGTFYRAQFGPYSESVQPGALCASLRAKGIDCQVIPN